MISGDDNPDSAAVVPPANVEELLSRCERLNGRTLTEIAKARGAAVPTDLKRNKGWVGQLLEGVLGATADGGLLAIVRRPHLRSRRDREAQARDEQGPHGRQVARRAAA